MSGSTGHIDNPEESIRKSMEAYRQELLADGWKEDDQGFKSLMALHHHFEVTPKEEIEQMLNEIEASGIGSEGPTVDEYFEAINPQFQYEKGYREGAKRYKTLLEEYFKQNKPMKLTGVDIMNNKPVFVEKDQYSLTQILEAMQHVFDNN